VMEVPAHLKDSSMDGKELGHGKGYKYAHDFEGHFVEQEYMPRKSRYYEPGEIGFEKQLKDRIESLWKRKQKP